MSTLFGNWEPTIIVVPPEIPPEPVIGVTPPNLSDPTARITSTRRVSTGSGDKIFTNAISDVSLAYSLKDNQAFNNFTVTDHICDDKAGLLRAYYGVTIKKLTAERIQLLRGHYSNGVTAGILNIGGTRIDAVVMRHCNYERAQPITSAGDIYAGLLTAGSKPDDPTLVTCNSVLIQDCRSRNTIADYTGTSSEGDYLNSDVAVFEKTIRNILIDGLDAEDGSDACVDMKGTGRLQRVIAKRFRESFKFWEGGQDGDVFTYAPRVAHWVIPAGGEIVERVVEFAGINSPEPSKPIVEFQKQPHKLILQRGYFEGDPNTQVLAKADSGAMGATVQMGDKSIVISKPITMLSELLS